jgi:hypothetical protein
MFFLRSTNGAFNNDGQFPKSISRRAIDIKERKKVFSYCFFSPELHWKEKKVKDWLKTAFL